MVGILWNCRGVAKKGRGNCIKDLLKDFKADFIGHQETMKQKFTEKFFRTIDPYQTYAWHWLPSKGKSGGILCGIKVERYEIIKVTEFDFALTAEIADKKPKKKSDW
jgi:hypothetical protein